MFPLMPSAFPPLTLQESQVAKLHRCVHASFSASAQFQGRNLRGKHKGNESILPAGTFPYSEVPLSSPCFAKVITWLKGYHPCEFW